MAASAAMDLRRRAQIMEGKPNEHDGEVFIKSIADFDIQKTIFKTVSPEFMPTVKENMAKEIFWSDQAVARIEAKASKMLSDPKVRIKDLNPELLKFMKEECEFNIEHADGSFLDHLQFCYVYGSVHMPAHSAVPLFLHSIMGVGTNLFPMKLELKDRLAELVSSQDLVHIEAFPTVLRLLNTRTLLDRLLAMSEKELSQIEGLQCCRLIGPNMDHDGQVGKSDNAPVHLNAEEFWVHLNYHLIHTMDFLPPDQWREQLEFSLLHVFIDLHGLLKRAGKLMANIDFDSDMWSKELRAKRTPESTQSVENFKAYSMSFSQRIGHRLDYTLKGKVGSPQSRL